MAEAAPVIERALLKSKAKQMYISQRGVRLETIAKALKVTRAELEHWVVSGSWEQDRIQYQVDKVLSDLPTKVEVRKMGLNAVIDAIRAIQTMMVNAADLTPNDIAVLIRALDNAIQIREREFDHVPDRVIPF